MNIINDSKIDSFAKLVWKFILFLRIIKIASPKPHTNCLEIIVYYNVSYEKFLISEKERGQYTDS